MHGKSTRKNLCWRVPLKKIGSLCLCVFFPAVLWAAGITITASLDKATVQVGEPFTYKIQVSGPGIGSPSIVIPDTSQVFTLRSQSRQQSLSIFNGVSSAAKIFNYVLVPKKVGSFVFPPSTTRIKGQTYKTRELSVNVIPDIVQKESPQKKKNVRKPSARIFAHAQVSKESMYVGEEVVYELSLYRRVRLWSNISYEIPEFTGFWAEELKVKKEQDVKMVDNMNYHTQELVRKSLFPIKEGLYTIASSKVAFVVHPFDGEQRVESEAKQIHVLPLPTEDMPASFMGLVGRFDFKLMNDYPRIATQNTPFSLSFSLSGEGGLTRVSDVHVESTDDFKVYRSNISDHISFRKGVSGRRDFEYIVVPRISGAARVPTFTVTYFSPRSKTYISKSVGAQTLQVSPSGQSDRTFVDTQGPVALSRDLRYLNMPMDLDSQDIYFWENRVYQAVFSFISLGAFLCLFRYSRQRLFKTGSENKTAKQAYPKAFKTLRNLDMDASHVELVAQLQQCVYHVLSERSGVSVQGFTASELATLLREKGVDVELVTEIGALLEAFSKASYSGSYSDNSEGLVQRVAVLLKRLKSKAKGF